MTVKEVDFMFVFVFTFIFSLLSYASPPRDGKPNETITVYGRTTNDVFISKPIVKIGGVIFRSVTEIFIHNKLP